MVQRIMGIYEFMLKRNPTGEMYDLLVLQIQYFQKMRRILNLFPSNTSLKTTDLLVKARDDIYTITIEVADEGIGIAKEEVLSIFNSYYRST